MSGASWGVISTIKAPKQAVLNFCAHHLEMGADRLYIYLDEPDQDTFKSLKSHPKIRPVQCDAEWWAKRKSRPDKHQARQFLNARHACNRRADVDWLTHIDCDEFLLSDQAVSEVLEAMPLSALCGRIRPIEALADDPQNPTQPDTCFKAFHLPLKERNAATDAIFPEFGPYLSGGFLSHVAGKMFFRAGIGMKVKIHNAYLDDDENPGLVEMPDLSLAHLHAESWEAWRAQFDYRLDRGSYRAALGPPPGRVKSGLNMHQMFHALIDSDGEDGLRRFHQEVCVATPELQARLADHGLLRRVNLELDRKRAAHFPDE